MAWRAEASPQWIFAMGDSVDVHVDASKVGASVRSVNISRGNVELP